EPVGQLPVLGQRANPFAVLIDEATKLPSRKLEREQRKRCLHDAPCLDEAEDSCPASRRLCRGTQTRASDHVSDEVYSNRRGTAKLLLQLAQARFLVRVERHGIVSLERRAPALTNGQNAIKKRDGEGARDIGISDTK